MVSDGKTPEARAEETKEPSRTDHFSCLLDQTIWYFRADHWKAVTERIVG